MMVFTLFLSLVLYIYYVLSLFLEPTGNTKKENLVKILAI